MKTESLYTYLSGTLKALAWNPYLKAIRNGLTLTLPLVMAGSVALLIANFPVDSYAEFMDSVFGNDWRLFAVRVSDATFNLLSIIMLLTISFSLAEHHNTTHRNREMHPAVVALVSLASLIALTQPYLFGDYEGSPGGQGLPVIWLGIHGLFLAIFVAFASSLLFLTLKRIPWLNISFYSEEADSTISYAFAAMFPGMITVFLFAVIKTVMVELGVENLHESLYEIMSVPFSQMGNTYTTAIFYNFCRHFFWFFGIHGSNLMEPITNALYSPAMEANIAAAAAGEYPPFIFTRTFFDAFISIGGSGSTISLMLAVWIQSRRGSMAKISQLSLAPALFNINEMIMFGLPIVLNPIFLIPFILTPLVLTTVAYLATAWHLVPPTTQVIGWTTPAFIGGYTATGSYAGAVLQGVCILIGAVIYYPFVRIAADLRREAFNQAFKELMPGYAESIGKSDYVVTGEARALSRSLANDLSEAIRRDELSLEYQPQVDSTTGKVFGVEALMRWNHSHLGRIPPGLFIGLAEEANLIKDLGIWALDESCRQLDEWRQRGITDVTMSVNLSVHQLDDDNIVNEIAEKVMKYNIPPKMLEVEVTESAALDGGDARNE